MKVKKKGFTLIELLAALAIMGVIITISFYSFISYKKKSEEKILKIEAEQIKVAALTYLREMETEDTYKSYKIKNEDTGEEIEKSCISIRKLQEMGYYKGDLKFASVGYNDAVVRVTKINGVADFEVITNYNPVEDEATDKHCYYDKYDGKAFDSQVELKSDDNNTNISINISETNVPGEYGLKFNLTSKVLEIIEETSETSNSDQPIDVMMIVDRSGSMDDTEYAAAYDAVESFSSDLYNNFQNSRVGLVEFSDDSDLIQDFSHGKLIRPTERKDRGMTNTSAGLEMALERFIQSSTFIDLKSKEQTIKYAILFTDGGPGTIEPSDDCYNFDDKCKSTLNNLASSFADKNITLIIVGYGLSSSNESFFRDLSSVNKVLNEKNICPSSSFTDSYGNLRCYYSSNSTSSFASIFQSISKTINTLVPKKSVTNVKIVATFSKDLIMKDLSGKRVKELEIDIEVEDGKINAENRLNETFRYTVSTKNVRFDKCDFKDDEGNCANSINIFDSYSVLLYDSSEADENGKKYKPNKTTVTGKWPNPKKIHKLSQMPEITISKKLVDYINR